MSLFDGKADWFSSVCPWKLIGGDHIDAEVGLFPGPVKQGMQVSTVEALSFNTAVFITIDPGLNLVNSDGCNLTITIGSAEPV